MKKNLYSETAYILGVVFLAIGTAIMEKADFGLSMVVAPAYLLHLKLSQSAAFFTFGIAEYMVQALLLAVVLFIQKKFKPAYVLSFGSVLLYGLLLDIFIVLFSQISAESMAGRAVCFLLGFPTSSLGVAMLFNTYVPPGAYEFFVKELSVFYKVDISRFKTRFDIVCCAVAVVLSFVFFGFGHFEGVKLGTVICAVTNGWIIGKFSGLITKHFEITDKFPFRKYFL